MVKVLVTLEYAILEDVYFVLELATVVIWTVIDDEGDNWGRAIVHEVDKKGDCVDEPYEKLITKAHNHLAPELVFQD